MQLAWHGHGFTAIIIIIITIVIVIVIVICIIFIIIINNNNNVEILIVAPPSNDKPGSCLKNSVEEINTRFYFDHAGGYGKRLVTRKRRAVINA